MLLQHMTWREVEAYLEHSRGILIPAGSTEQHGPSGMIGTDALCAEHIARRAAELGPVLVGPTLTLGSAQFNLAFPGTVSLRPTTLIAVARDYVSSLAGQGFRRFYFLNGHGGNVAPLRCAFQELYADLGDGSLRCRLRSWWDLPGPGRLRRELYGEREGVHATPSEIAITRHAVGGEAPTAGATFETLPPGFTRDHPDDDHYDARSHRRAFPEGHVGSDPTLATPEAGARLLEAAAADAAAEYAAFLEQ